MTKKLYFKNYKIISDSILFKYEFDNKYYTIEYIFNDLLKDSSFNPQVDYTIDRLICYLGIVSTFNLFNLDYFDEVIVECIKINKEDNDFFSELSYNGLAEFRYVNNINMNKKVKFSSNCPDNHYKYKKPKLFLNKKSILLNGGGKDSAVASEILKSVEEDFNWLTLNMNTARKKVISISKIENYFSLSRILDKKIATNGKYSGHKPVSALLAFISLLYAYVYRYEFIVTANEHSANFINLKINGVSINHQYTKSIDFEKKFNSFIKNRLFEGITYYSILRPLYEIQITKIFSSYKQYFTHFISCNTGIKENRWCLQCSKCAFIFLALAPFISITDIKKIWGYNLFSNEKITDEILKLVDNSPKPFDCVGTKEECRLSLYLCNKKGLLNGIREDTKKNLAKYIRNYNFKKNFNKYLLIYNRRNNIPKNILPKIRKFWRKILISKT